MFSVLLVILSGAVVVSFADNRTDVSTLPPHQILSIVGQNSALRSPVEIEKIVIAISQSFAYLISHLNHSAIVKSDGATPYVTCAAIVILLVLKFFTIIKKYWKNGAGGEYEMSQS